MFGFTARSTPDPNDGEEEEDSDDNQSGDEGNSTNARPDGLQDFDTNIPGVHKYLGKLDNVSGYTLFDDGQIVELNGMFTNTLAFPGFTLPLVISDRNHDLQVGHNFVLICFNADHNDFYDYGVVMEVYELSHDEGRVNLKAKGRQRCYVPGSQLRPMSRHRWFKVKVQILPEPVFPNPLTCSQLLTLKQKFRYFGDYRERDRHYNKCRRLHLAQFPFPDFVYNLYDVEYYVNKIAQILSKFYATENIPRDPTILSYWFGQNFQLKHAERLRILSSHTTLERLQLEYKFLTQEERMLCCDYCGCSLATQGDVFSMSKEGVQSNYVNPGGVVYEIVTIKAVFNVSLEGRPSKQFSWFPGYAWTILKCRQCTGHLGWQFTSKKLQPRLFYGLARSSIRICEADTSKTSGRSQRKDGGSGGVDQQTENAA